MDKSGTIRFWINPRPGWSREAQLERATGEIYEAGAKDKGAKTRAELIKSIRRGDTVQVCELYLLALDIGRSDKQRRDMLATVDAIEAKRGVVVEVGKGFHYRSNIRREWAQMQAEAFYRLALAGKGRRSAANGKLSKGRPKKELTPEQSRTVDLIWHDGRLKNDDQRCAKIHTVTGLKLKRGFLRTRFGSPHVGAEKV